MVESLDRSESGEVTIFMQTRGRWWGIDSFDFEDVAASGSGAEEFLNHIVVQHAFGSSHQRGDFIFAKQMTLIFAAKFLAKERLTLNSLKNYWGAFIEMCFFNGESFEKVRNIVFVMNDITFDTDGNANMPIPNLFIFSNYQGTTLFLTVVEASHVTYVEESDGYLFTSENIKKSLFCVREMDQPLDVSMQNLNTDSSFQTNEVAMGYLCQLSPNSRFAMGSYSRGVDVSVELLDGQRIELRWPKHLQERVENTANAAFSTLNTKHNLD